MALLPCLRLLHLYFALQVLMSSSQMGLSRCMQRCRQVQRCVLSCVLYHTGSIMHIGVLLGCSVQTVTSTHLESDPGSSCLRLLGI